MRNTAYHQQANLITTQVLQEIRTDHSRVIDELKNTGNEILHAMQVSQHIPELESETQAKQESTNAVTGNALQAQMLKTLQLMQAEIQELKRINKVIPAKVIKRNANRKNELIPPSIAGRMEHGVMR